MYADGVPEEGPGAPRGPPGVAKGGPRLGVTWLPPGSPLAALRAPLVISDKTPFSPPDNDVARHHSV